MTKPILIIQMQRMGDLILSFPLFLWLQQMYPQRRIRVLARRLFFEELLPVSPAVDYIDPDYWKSWSGEKYFLSLNLSLGPVAAQIQANVDAEEKFGPIMEGGNLRVLGNWQLYRASLVHNNKYNLMHWADMNALDVVPLHLIQKTRWPQVRQGGSVRRRIGLFIGASQPEKRPDAVFWAQLAEELLRRKCFPVFLGGQAEQELAFEIESCLQTRIPAYCGQFSLSQLADFARNLDLLVTPDTGPMHLAAWTSVRVLNLSLGPVNPWETGPYQPGHFILSADIACRGCWECQQPVIECRQAFIPSRVAALIQEILKKESVQLQKMRPAGLNLFTTSRFPSGLYQLQPAQAKSSVGAEMACSLFWQSFFCHILSGADENCVRQAGSNICSRFPQLHRTMSEGLTRLARQLVLCRQNPVSLLDGPTWLDCVPELRSLSGYVQLFMQNEGLSRACSLHSIELVERALFFLDSGL